MCVCVVFRKQEAEIGQPCTLTPDYEVSGRLIDAPGVARHASVGPGIRDVRGRDEQAAGLEEGEARQLD